MTPQEIAQAGFWLTMQYATIAVLMYSVLVFVLLRVANKLSGINFGLAFDNMDSRSQSIYLSTRYAVHGFSTAIILAAVFQYA